MTSPRFIRMRRLVLKSRASAEADYILSLYQHEWGWMSNWPDHILDRCEAAIREAMV